MILHLVKSTQGLVGTAALALLVLAGCSSQAGQPTGRAPLGDASDAAVVQAVYGTATGTYHNGHLSFSAITPHGSLPGLTPQGFGPFTQSLASFDTAAGDGVGTNGCSATQYCAVVTMTNNTGRAMENVYVEITDYFAITPTTATPFWAGGAVTLSTAYTSAFKNSGQIEASNFGNLAVGQAQDRIFNFEIGGSTDFSFHVQVLATFPKNQISGSYYTGMGSSFDFNACTMSGHTGPDAIDDGETDFQMPFAFTLTDLTYDKATIGSNGYFLPYSTGGAAPSLLRFNNGADNQTLLQAPFPEGFFPFWDDLAYDAGGGLCTAVTGATPSRTLVVTWSGAKIANNQPSPSKTFTTEKVTYSLVLFEQTDTMYFWYNLPSTGVPTTLSEGGSATIGFIAKNGGSDQTYLLGLNGPSLPPASASGYSAALVVAQYNPNP